MAHCLVAERRPHHAADVITRFDPTFWTINFPRPMMAAVTTTAPDALRVDCAFYRRDNLAGLIWEAEDRHDHPLLAYDTERDFRACRLSFRWRSGGVRPLDAIHGPVLTIEGRDAAGVARAWYVRLWNYAVGTPEDAVIAIDFAGLTGGFDLPTDADPVWAGDVDRLFISFVAPGYDASDAMLDAPAEGWAELSAIRCEGAGSVIGMSPRPARGWRWRARGSAIPRRGRIIWPASCCGLRTRRNGPRSRRRPQRRAGGACAACMSGRCRR